MSNRMKMSSGAPADDAKRVAALATALRSQRYERLALDAGQFMLNAARVERRYLLKPAARLVAAAQRRDAAGSVEALVYLARRVDRAA